MTQHPAAANLYGDPPPGGQARVIETADGVGLRFAHWPAKGEARGAILLAQGRSEYIEKAYEWIGKFQERGLIVGAFDFRGQGLSQRMLPNRRRGYVENFGLFQADYDAAYDTLRREIGDLPIIVCGHSMGGLVTARFLSRRQSDVHAAILSAPMLGLAFSRPINWIAFMISGVLKALGYGARYVQGCDDRAGPERGFEGNVLTQDAARFKRHGDILRAHPDLVLGGATHSWLAEGYREMARVAALPDGWLKVLTLALSADEDTVVSNKAIARLMAANPDVTERIHLANSRHEPLMELDAVQAVLWPALDAFLDRHLPPTPPPSASR